MILTIGNIITLLVVIVVLIIYRQLDRSNRSLDKVKRYSDKIRGDLSGFVEDKTTELKNLSIELDVHQKSAKEILKRITSIEEGLKGKTAGFDKIQTRITEYDKALSDLVTMTARVEENLKRLHQESEFVDMVGRHVKEAGARMAAIEKSLPELKEEFARINEKELKEVAARAVKATKDDLLAIERQVGEAEKSVKGFAAYLTTLEGRRDALEAQTVKNLQTAFQGFLQNAKDSSIELRKQFETNLNVLLEKASSSGEAVTDRIRMLQGQLSQEVEATERALQEKLESFQERVGAIEQTYQENLRDVSERAKSLEDDVFVQLQGHIEARAREVQKQLAAALAETKNVVDGSRKEFSQMFGETRSRLAVWQAEIQKFAEDRETELNGRYERFTHEVEQRVGAYVEQTDKEKDDQERELASFLAEVRDRLDELSSTVDDKEKSFQDSLEEIEKRNNSLADSVMERFAANVTDFEERMNSRLVEVESRVAEYESDVSYRFTKMEEANVDVEDLERNLRELMEKIKAKVQGDFDLFTSQLADRRAEERKRAEAELASVHQAVEELERGLTELTSKAYENVSAKLQVFEDDFFADLRSREENLNARLAEWQVGMKERLAEMGSEGVRMRDQLEREYGEELTAKLAEQQNRVLKSYQAFEERALSFEDAIKKRMDLSDGSTRSFEESIRQELVEAREAAQALFRREFAEHTEQIDERVRDYGREIESELAALGERMSASKQDFAAMLAAAKSEVSAWQEDVLSRTQEAEAEVARMEEGVKSRAERALSSAEEITTAFLTETETKTKALREEADQRVESFRVFAEESLEKTDALTKKLAAKAEESYRALSANLQDIERRTKEFAAQTKLFERADTLKAELLRAVEEIKGELGKVQAEVKEIREAEKGLQKTRKMGEEVSAKLGKFLAEKRRIEVMEGDFKKLLSMSQSVDGRLSQVTASHDQLQTIQAQIRGLEELEKEVMAKYERLEGKKEILDVTTEGVDKSFQNLERLETGLRALEEGLASLSPRVGEASERIDTLAKNKKEADQAVAQLSNLGAMLKEIEERTEKMQTAREWLARTETRLEEIGRQAEDQVKLLGSLLKEEGKAAGKKSDKGAPSMSTRDMVTRLAHQGWKVPQIAQATKLSRGEVELILELLPKTTPSK